MNKTILTISGIIFLTLGSFISVNQSARAECLPEEITGQFTIREEAGGISILAVSETLPEQVDHVKLIYNALLKKDDDTGGILRKAISQRQPSVLIVNSGRDFDEDGGKYARAVSACPVQVFQLAEIVPYGSPGETQYGVRDATVEEMINLVYQYGIMKANSGWIKRLKKAMDQAVSGHIFSPQISDPDQLKDYWPATYLVLGLEVYYNFWADKDSVRGGGYAFKSRATLEQGDPELFKLIEEIFPDSIRPEKK
ncbi:MAG: hypothetical protein AB7S78_13615 [Candidatus Omnitrophota bacterium]